MRNTLLLGLIVAVLMFLLTSQVLKLFKVEVPMLPVAIVSVIAAVGGSINTLKEDSGLSFMGHLIVSTILAVCIVGATGGFFTLTGQLPGLPRWVAISMIIGGIVLFLGLAGLLGRGPA